MFCKPPKPHVFNLFIIEHFLPNFLSTYGNLSLEESFFGKYGSTAKLVWNEEVYWFLLVGWL